MSCVLYYSNYCSHSKNILIKLSNTDIKSDQKVLTIDISESNNLKGKISNGFLPTSSTFYQINEDYDFEASATYDIVSTEYVDGINMSTFIDAGYDVNNSSKFPKDNLIISEPQIFRGIVV